MKHNSKQKETRSLQPSILLVDSSYPMNTRNERIVASLRQSLPNVTIRCICWNRDGREVAIEDIDNLLIYNAFAPYGNKFRKLSRLWGFLRYLADIERELKPDVVVASHWDSLLLCALIKQRGQTLVYENLDLPTCSSRPLLRLLQIVEKLCLRRTDAIVFASRFFEPLYASFPRVKMVVENKLPSVISRPVVHRPLSASGLVLTYLGNVRYAKILLNLVEAVGSMEGVTCRIYGGGPDFERVACTASLHANVEMLGRYDYRDVPRIYEASDVVWAVYPSCDYNVRYAISNKYHESVCYGIPAIYAEDTELARMISKSGTGFVVNPYSVESIRNLVTHLRDYKAKTLGKAHLAMDKWRLKEYSSWEKEIKPLLDYMQGIFQ